MSRTRGGPSNIERRRKQGFGEGEGAAYKPWSTARSFSSRGMTHRVFSEKTGRIHHYFSTSEMGCGLLLEWSEEVLDYREQFPMHDLAETREIAAALGYEHPTRRRRSKGQTIEEDMVMTVDFLVTLAREINGTRQVAISVKLVESLNDLAQQRRTLEKEEIARRYWERRGIPFRFVTDRELPRVLIENLSLVFHYVQLDGFGIPGEEIPYLLDHLYDRVAAAPGVPVNRTCALTDERLRLSKGTSAALVWHAIAKKVWYVDMTVRLDPERPLHGLSMATSTQRRRIA
jgi:hypothetical protein